MTEETPQGGDLARPGPAGPAAPADVTSRVTELEGELARLRADATREAHVLMQVAGAHVSFSFAGVTVGTDPTPVPEHLAAALLDAAADAGVHLILTEV